MKKNYMLLLFILLYSSFLIQGQNTFSGTSAEFVTDSKKPVISVLLPDDGDLYYFAEPLLVKWVAEDESFGSDPVTISISLDGGVNYDIIVSGLPNSDSAYVSTPGEITDLAKIKVFVQDEFGLTAFDESDGTFSLQGINVDLKAYLEGPFNGSDMETYLNSAGLIPDSQPYNCPPWNYPGTESISGMPNSNVVDWVLVEIRDAADSVSATPDTRLARQAGFILQNGNVTGLDGSSNLLFGYGVNQNLYAVIWHRNHLGIMSANPLTVNDFVFSYDFTDSENKVFGGSAGHKLIGGNIWGLAGGDGNADGQVTYIDLIDWWKPNSGMSGYKGDDFNLDGQTDNADKNDIWFMNTGLEGQVPE